jgi:hypothetical protein
MPPMAAQRQEACAVESWTMTWAQWFNDMFRDCREPITFAQSVTAFDAWCEWNRREY